ncbi:MAG: hypothetical protein Q8O11_05420, partial [Syntrophales bacterium]|nr:hypothetical protein [Syntrophales bacterium]
LYRLCRFPYPTSRKISTAICGAAAPKHRITALTIKFWNQIVLTSRRPIPILYQPNGESVPGKEDFLHQKVQSNPAFIAAIEGGKY